MSAEFLPFEPVAAIDPAIFEIVEAQYHLIPSIYTDLLRPVWSTHKYYNDLKQGLSPAIEELAERDGRAPSLVYVDLISCTAEPGQPFVSDWARTWHVDSPRDEADCEIAVASTQPTESIHGSLDHPDLANNKIQTGLAFINRFTEQVLVEEHGLVISQGMPNYAMLYGERTAHRAAVNTTDQPVSRQLLFAGLNRRHESLRPTRR